MANCACNNFPSSLGNVTFGANVGIQTPTGPSERLAVYGSGAKALVGPITAHTVQFSGYDSYNNSVLEVNSDGTGTNPAAQVTMSNSNAGANAEVGGVNFLNTALASDKRLVSVVAFTDVANNSGRLVFYVANAGSFAERMRITPAGNVGIGRTNPATTLDVNGTVSATGILMNGSGPIIFGGTIQIGNGTVRVDQGGCYYAT